MLILDIDGQKYAGQSYIDTESTHEHRLLVEALAKEVAETVLLHYGYTGVVELASWTPTQEAKETK